MYFCVLVSRFGEKTVFDRRVWWDSSRSGWMSRFDVKAIFRNRDFFFLVLNHGSVLVARFGERDFLER